MKIIRMFIADILMFLGIVVAYMIAIAGKIAGLEAYGEGALKKEIACPSCGMDMRIHAKHNADTIAKLEAVARAADTLLDAPHIIERTGELQRTLDALPEWALEE